MLLDQYNHRYFQAGPTFHESLQYGLHEVDGATHPIQIIR